ncbi:MAG: general stress protein [Chitinophagales bacterium]
MTTTIGIYETHEQAVAAVKKLKDADFPLRQVSVLGQAEGEKSITEDTADEMSAKAGKGVGIGALAGSTLGLLTGAGIFAIPGVGFLFGAGALLGAIAGLDLGLLGGGIIGALSIGLSKEHHEKYDQHLKEGKFMLIVHGTEGEVKWAGDVLKEHGDHVNLESH